MFKWIANLFKKLFKKEPPPPEPELPEATRTDKKPVRNVNLRFRCNLCGHTYRVAKLPGKEYNDHRLQLDAAVEQKRREHMARCVKARDVTIIAGESVEEE